MTTAEREQGYLDWLDATESPKLWATWVEEDAGLDVPPRSYLVVVPARDHEEAQRETGLLYEDFHPATDAEVEEWYDVSEAALDDWEVTTLLWAIRRAQKMNGNTRLKDRRTGRWEEGTPLRFDSNRQRARRLAVLRGKLENIATDEEGVT